MYLNGKNLREAQENFACFGIFQGLTAHFVLSQPIHTKVGCEIQIFKTVRRQCHCQPAQVFQAWLCFTLKKVILTINFHLCISRYFLVWLCTSYCDTTLEFYDIQTYLYRFWKDLLYFMLGIGYCCKDPLKEIYDLRLVNLYGIFFRSSKSIITIFFS